MGVVTETNVMVCWGMLVGRGFVGWKDENELPHTEQGVCGGGKEHTGRPHIGRGSTWFQS